MDSDYEQLRALDHASREVKVVITDGDGQDIRRVRVCQECKRQVVKGWLCETCDRHLAEIGRLKGELEGLTVAFGEKEMDFEQLRTRAEVLMLVGTEFATAVNEFFNGSRATQRKVLDKLAGFLGALGLASRVMKKHVPHVEKMVGDAADEG
jgi:hypothetical protein